MFDIYKDKTGAIEEEFIARDFLFDIKANKTVLKDGSPVLVTGILAIKGWIYKTLMTKRGFYTAYSFNHGQDYDELIASPLSYAALKAEARRYTQEAVLVHKCITGVENFEFEIFEDSMKISFIAITTYGVIEMEVGI